MKEKPVLICSLLLQMNEDEPGALMLASQGKRIVTATDIFCALYDT